MGNGGKDDKSGTIRLAGAASILLACVIGWLVDPFGAPSLSAGIFGLIAGISFAARGLFNKKM